LSRDGARSAPPNQEIPWDGTPNSKSHRMGHRDEVAFLRYGSRHEGIRLCACGHPYLAHQHYRRGTECSLCPDCPRWRRSPRVITRATKRLISGISSAMICST
jgi:hypothetical protein